LSLYVRKWFHAMPHTLVLLRVTCVHNGLLATERRAGDEHTAFKLLLSNSNVYRYVAGAMFVDDKTSDDTRGYTEFLDMLIRLSWYLLTEVNKESVPLSRRGVGAGLRVFIEQYLVPRPTKRVQPDEEFEAAYGAVKWKKGAMKDIVAGVGKVFKGVIGNNAKEVGLEPFTGCCKEWKAVGSDLSLLKCRLYFVEISDSEMDKDGVPKWFKVINLNNLMLDPEDEAEEERLKLERKIQKDIEKAEKEAAKAAKAAAAEAVAAVAAAAAAAAAGDDAPLAGELEADDDDDDDEDEDKPKKKGKGDKLKGGKSKKGGAKLEADDIDEEDTMSVKEFLKIIARMAWVLFPGKPIEDRLQKFAAKHLQL
jgi:hypothetical protein